MTGRLCGRRTSRPVCQRFRPSAVAAWFWPGEIEFNPERRISAKFAPSTKESAISAAGTGSTRRSRMKGVQE
jgi:hypothetical protein